MAFEYFDVPYRYNETCIKLLFQSPHILYAYWDVSDEDENSFIEKYGEHTYYNSRIYLEITNTSNGKKFEIDVNPFTKNWYIHIDEPNCKYIVKLCRTINNQKIDITSSNILTVPTDAPHFPRDNFFTFMNIKTNEVAFTLNQEQAIDAINKIGPYAIDIEKATKDKRAVGYILNNPSSMSNVSSGNRYMNKEDING